MGAYSIVDEFERVVAKHVGAKHGVALDNCTNALFLSAMYLKWEGWRVSLPRHTFIAAPMAMLRAGAMPVFRDAEWIGQYPIHTPHDKSSAIWDSATQLEKGSYNGGFMCVSFQYRKPIPIGKGGMVLTDDWLAAQWMRRVRNNGRGESPFPYPIERITEMGYNMHMMPEQAARGLALLELRGTDGRQGKWSDYPDVSVSPLWSSNA